ncbi:MAG TPA: Gfo/Idh/MocA family oxidoreductase [Armatimonadota bacterium]|nr:Gfo/Idh/MocA family oxidoreductase [Armatimonadota bacterium]
MQKVAIVGAGHMAKVHAAAYANMLNAEPVAIMDIREDAANELATAHDAQAFTCQPRSLGDFEEMLKTAKPTVVDVCVPTPWHKEYVVKAAEAGKHVVTEKPMARTLDDCKAMIDATKSAGVTFMVAHVLRYFPEFAAAKAQVDAGAVGSPAVVRTTRGGGFPHGWNDWYANFDWSGGVALDLIIHDFDWLRWCFGDAERVFAKGLVDRELKHLDYALVTIRFKSGVIAHVEGTWAMPAGFAVKFEVAGDKGLLDFVNKNAVPLMIARKESDKVAAGVAIPESPTAQNPYFLELEHFIDCVETGNKPSITPEDGLRAVEISLAALESIRTGKPITLSA